MDDSGTLDAVELYSLAVELRRVGEEEGFDFFKRAHVQDERGDAPIQVVTLLPRYQAMVRGQTTQSSPCSALSSALPLALTGITSRSG